MALGTLETFAAYRGVTFDPTDVQAALAVASAEAFARRYCDQVFDLVEDDEVLLDGTGTTTLILPELPVTELMAVTTIANDGTETELAITDYELGGSGILWRSDGGTWERGIANVSVVYSHGYLELPEDLTHAILGLASRGMNESGGREVSEERIGTYQVSYGEGASASGLLDDERVVLDSYRQTMFAR